MATSTVHLRVAEIVCNHLHIEKQNLFFVGSIAPDNEFSADDTHFCNNGDKQTCDLHLFYNKYLLNGIENWEFYLGYYVHLATDVYWQKHVLKPLRRLNKNIRECKLEWNKVDCEFWIDNSEFLPVLELQNCRNVKNKWFDYAFEDTVENSIERVIRGSQLVNMDKPSDVARNEILQFINDCSQWIIQNLKEYKIE